MTEPITVVQRKPPKSPAAAGILSGVLAGAGQLYNGEATKALLFFVIFAGLISIMPHGPQPFLPLLFAAFWFYQIIEAVQTAKAINLRALGAEIAAAPGAPAAAAAVPGAPDSTPSGSVFWGGILIAVGAVLLLGNFNIIDYDRIFDFWPLVVIAIGVKMIVDYLRKKNA
jgi:TM2 domain-containing membrane protein YozV